VARAAATAGIDNKTETRSKELLKRVELFIIHLRTAVRIFQVNEISTFRSGVESLCELKINQTGIEWPAKSSLL
jgi:hypothetical protein